MRRCLRDRGPASSSDRGLNRPSASLRKGVRTNHHGHLTEEMFGGSSRRCDAVTRTRRALRVDSIVRERRDNESRLPPPAPWLVRAGSGSLNGRAVS